jgi:beta-galactosidase GanA
MRRPLKRCCEGFWLSLLAFAAAHAAAPDPGMPHLVRQGAATQLVVDGRPFLMVGGELLNSSSSNRAYMQTLWPGLASLPLNTVLTPVSWAMIEPSEGRYDFELLDGLLADARQANLHLVLLWLASWKNGMSSYPPVWVKQDTGRFLHVPDRNGDERELLSTFGAASRAADARAFAALMRHLREVDGRAHTVLMIQVENECGILNDTRDRSAPANRAFAGPVPAELMDYLQAHRDGLIPEFAGVWAAAGGRTAGTWEQVFGSGPRTDEIFMAWNYARYVGAVAAAGKAEYPIPMYANAWLPGDDAAAPGTYPCGGPLARVIDVWHAGAPAIDVLAPDLYAPNFAEWCARFKRAGNPLFIPETKAGEQGAWAVFYAVGQEDAMGFSPFGIDIAAMRSRPDLPKEFSAAPLARSYAMILQLSPLILAHQGLGQMTAFHLTADHPAVTATLNGYAVQIGRDALFGNTVKEGYGLVIAVGPDEFLGAGTGFWVTFKPLTPGPKLAGLASVEEGTYRAGTWTPGRRLNGDETDQGGHWRFPSYSLSLQRCAVYRYP